MSTRWLLVPGLAWAFAGSARAHEFRPSVVEVREVQLGLYALQAPAGLRVRAPGCSLEEEQLRCEAALSPATLRLASDVAPPPGGVVLRWVPRAGAPSLRVLGAESHGSGVASGTAPSGFLSLGFWHALLGWDHALFVCLLVAWAGGASSAMARVLGFSAGHLVSTAAATWDWIGVSTQWAEMMIAASLALAAADAQKGKRPGAASALAFGSIHGLGFAQAFREAIPEDPRALDLLAFGAGVEAAQVLYVLACLGLLAAASAHRDCVRGGLTWATGIAGATWLFVRAREAW